MADETRRLTRRELYDLVWTKPVDTIAKELGMSGRGLGKLCERPWKCRLDGCFCGSIWQLSGVHKDGNLDLRPTREPPIRPLGTHPPRL